MKPLSVAKFAIVIIIGVLFLKSSSKDVPRGIRNNNPMNIRENDLVDFDWVGEARNEWDPDFEEFTDPVYGIRAGARILRTYRQVHGLTTITGIINRWAPARDNNDVPSYISSVVRRTGKSADEEITFEDYPKLVDAIIHHENGQQPYSERTIIEGVKMGIA